jgi:hypothetical protein
VVSLQYGLLALIASPPFTGMSVYGNSMFNIKMVLIVFSCDHKEVGVKRVALIRYTLGVWGRSSGHLSWLRWEANKTL